MNKKKFAAILAVSMLVSALAGCGQNSVVSQESSSTEVTGEVETSASSEAEETMEEKELITIQHLAFNRTVWQDDFYKYTEGSDVYKEVVKQTGIQLEEIGLAEDQVQIRIASGDLGDLISVYNTEQLVDLIESDLLIPLNDLIEEYAPEIMENYPERWESACSIGNDEGIAYCLPVNAGKEGWKEHTERYLYTVRWDLYKELGYPEMNTPEDLIEVLSDMLELQPKTADGKKLYGAGFYVTDTSYYGMVCLFQGTYGYIDVKGHYITRNVQTGDLCYDMINENSPYWMAVDYYNKAYRAGILDPDSFTQQAADFDAKYESGESLASLGYNTYYELAQLAENPESISGFMNIPVEGTMCYQNANQIVGWASCASALCIPKTCQNPERVVEYINYLFSEEGSRVISSGVEGIHWDYVDGVPTYKEEIYEIFREGGDASKMLNLLRRPLSYMTGIGRGELASDGYQINLKYEDDYLSRLTLRPSQMEYNEYYDVDHPIQAMQKMVDEGKIYDMSGIDYRVNLTEFDEDISRIDSACLKIAIEAIPKLVTAADDATFEAVKADTLAALEAAGAKEAEAFYTKQWEANRAKFAD